jgi:hypothetical protein
MALPHARLDKVSRLRIGVFTDQELQTLAKDVGRGKTAIRKLTGSDNFSFFYGTQGQIQPAMGVHRHIKI